jgi:hypothetical protein
MGVVVPDMHDAAHRKLKIQNSKFKEEYVLRDRRKRIPDRKGIEFAVKEEALNRGL